MQFINRWIIENTLEAILGCFLQSTNDKARSTIAL